MTHLIAGQPLEQPQLRPGRRDRHGVEKLPGARLEPRSPGEHGVARAVRQRGLARGDRLGHVERIARGPRVQQRPVEPDRPGKVRDGGHR